MVSLIIIVASFLYLFTMAVRSEFYSGDDMLNVVVSESVAHARSTAFFTARDEIIDFIRSELLTRDIRYLARPWAPSTFEALKADCLPTRLVVDSSNSEHTIFESPEDNHAFRAFHDFYHLTLDADFSVNGERKVTNRQLRDARSAGLSHNAMTLYTAELRQYEHYFTHGRFPVDQRLFAFRWFVGGSAHALAKAC